MKSFPVFRHASTQVNAKISIATTQEIADDAAHKADDAAYKAAEVVAFANIQFEPVHIGNQPISSTAAQSSSNNAAAYSAFTTSIMKTAGHSGELVSHIVSFNEHRKAIDAVYLGLRGNGDIESVQKLDTIEIAKDKFDPSMRQMSLSGGFVNGIEELYESAAVASTVFSSILMVNVASLLTDLFPVICDRVYLAPLKDKNRAEEKARDDYSDRSSGPGVAWLYDIVRGMV